MRDIIQEKVSNFNNEHFFTHIFPVSNGFMYSNSFTIKCSNIVESEYSGIFIENIKSGYRVSFTSNEENISYLKFRGKLLYKIKYSL